jgi:hypothetical protein
MSERKPTPGVTREERLSDEGLRRLENQLQRGSPMSRLVLAQWIKRYGEAAREIIKRCGKYDPELD